MIAVCSHTAAKHDDTACDEVVLSEMFDIITLGRRVIIQFCAFYDGIHFVKGNIPMKKGFDLVLFRIECGDGSGCSFPGEIPEILIVHDLIGLDSFEGIVHLRHLINMLLEHHGFE